MTRPQITLIVETVFDSIKKSLAQGERIDIRNFGSFILRERKARKARNPKTGEEAEVPAISVPFFKPGKELREMVDVDKPKRVKKIAEEIAQACNNQQKKYLETIKPGNRIKVKGKISGIQQGRIKIDPAIII